ncbi:tetratricopeptide repeat protein [Streptomyces sp. NPDC090022]|uniref:tetratricopeptide repeat protein n=1 Tax=Streptomyces sp. NPDC090022 TaxID=3365920 RepID=UPI0037FE2CBD
MSGALERADLLYDLGRHDEAAALASQHLAQHPGDAKALVLLARCRRSLRDLPGALATIEEALRAEPDSVYAWMVRADTLSRLGRLHEAVASARRCVELAPLFWGSHHTLALVLERSTNRVLHKDAYASARRAVELEPQEASAHFMVGLTAHRVGDHTTARAAYETTLRLDPQSSEAHNNLALLDRKRGRFSSRAWRRAVEGFAESAALDADDRHARFNLETMAWSVAASARWSTLGGSVIALVTTVVPDAPAAVPWAGAALVAVLWGGWVLWQRHRIPPRLRRPMLMIVRGCRPVRAMALAAGLLGLYAVALFVMAAFGVRAADRVVLGGVGAALFWFMIVTYWAGRVAMRQRAPGRTSG